MSKFSLYAPGISNTIPSAKSDVVSCHQMIISNDLKEEIETLREIQDPDEKKNFKAEKLPFVTFSGEFHRRRKEDLASFSNIICLDIDDVSDVNRIKTEINKIKEFKPHLIFTSPSGSGIKAVYKIEGIQPDQVNQAYDYIADKVESEIPVTIDRAPKSVASACFLSFDREAILNIDAGSIPITISNTSSAIDPMIGETDTFHELKKIGLLVDEIEKGGHNIAELYDDWFKIGLAIASLGEGGRDLFHRVSRLSSKYKKAECDKEFDKCLVADKKITIGTFYKYCKDTGINMSETLKPLDKSFNLVLRTEDFWDDRKKEVHQKRMDKLLKDQNHTLVTQVAESFGVKHETLCLNRVGLDSFIKPDGGIEDALYIPYPTGCEIYWYDGQIWQQTSMSGSGIYESFFVGPDTFNNREVVVTMNPFDAMFLGQIRPDFDVISVIEPNNLILSREQRDFLIANGEYWYKMYVLQNYSNPKEEKDALTYVRCYSDTLRQDQEVFLVGLSNLSLSAVMENVGTSASNDIFSTGKYVWNTFTNKNRYWILTGDKTQRLEIDEFRLASLLDRHGFRKVYIGKSEEPILLYVYQNVVEEINSHRLFDHLREEILKKFSKFVDTGVGKNGPKYFSKHELIRVTFRYRDKALNSSLMAILDNSNLYFLKDTRKESYLYYKNVVVKVSKTRIDTIDYKSLPGFIWKDQIVNRNIDLDKSDSKEAVFKQFICRVTNNQLERVRACMSAYGYLIHQYKDPVQTRAVILTDEKIGLKGSSDGGTGKSLFANALKHIRKQRYIAGKNININSNFAFMDAKLGDQNLFFDDVKSDFDFEALFNVITNDMQVEPKYQNRFTIPFADSPKIILSTNSVILGKGNSYKRRQMILEFSNHYFHNPNPEKEFGTRFYEGWDEAEWNRFDRFMIECLQEYLAHGLTMYSTNSYKTRSIRFETDDEFVDWAESHLEEDVEYSANVLFDGDNRVNGGGDLKPTKKDGREFDPFLHISANLQSSQMRTFMKWLDSFAEYRDWNMTTRMSNGYKILKFIKK